MNNIKKSYLGSLKRFCLWFFGVSTLLVVVHVTFLYFLVAKLNIVNTFMSFYSEESIGGINILVFGIDDTRYVQRSDSLVVLHLNNERKYVGALSIPRDTRVDINGRGMSRINHAYAFGGVDLLKQTVSNFLAIPIDFYVKVEVSHVKKLIDTIGGIDITIDKAMTYTDYAGDLYINLPKGKQRLTGDQAVQFLRFRQDSDGDIGRIKRQQYFMQELTKQLVSFESLLKIPALIKSISSIVETDLKYSHMFSLVTEFKDSVSSQRINKTMVPGSVALIGGASYWRPDIVALGVAVDEVLLGFDVARKDIVKANSSQILAHNTDTVNSLTDHFQLSDNPLAHKVEAKVKNEVDETTAESGMMTTEVLDYDSGKPIDTVPVIVSSESLSDSFDRETILDLSSEIDFENSQESESSVTITSQLDFSEPVELKDVSNTTDLADKLGSDTAYEELSDYSQEGSAKPFDEENTSFLYDFNLQPLASSWSTLDFIIPDLSQLKLWVSKLKTSNDETLSSKTILLEDEKGLAILEQASSDDNLIKVEQEAVFLDKKDVLFKQHDTKHIDNPLVTQSKGSFKNSSQTKPSHQDDTKDLSSEKLDSNPPVVSRRFITLNEIKQAMSTEMTKDISDFSGMNCELLNGVGVDGIANNAANILQLLGINIPRCANAGNFDYDETIIIDWHGDIKRAVKIALLLKIDPQNIILYDMESKPLDVSLVLGKDWLEKEEILAGIYERSITQ